MSAQLRAILWLLATTLLVSAVLYPLALLGIGRAFFPAKAEGSLLRDRDGKVMGSRLIAQPFTGDGYFQPRPSAASYNAAASGASNWGASNYQLRDRVAKVLGPMVRYGDGAKKGQPVAPDIERWFQQDRFQGKPGIVAQWAQAHASLAQAWVKADKVNSAYLAAWQADHPAEVTAWIRENPDTPEPKPEDLAVPFFTSFAREHPGTFPSGVEHKLPDGKTEKRIEPVKEGSDVQGFFDLWRQDNPKVELENVPADLVMASGSGLDPHITLANALYQLDRVANKWAAETRRDLAGLRREIEQLLREKAEAPLGGLVGVDLINVLEVNLALRERYESASRASR
jgi:potassium-transporting ATPase KdpC subunit